MSGILRVVADDYEQAQHVRVAKGEQIRAILQHRDETFSDVDIKEELEPEEIETILHLIGKGEELGPVPYLGRSYHRSYEQERDAFKEMIVSVEHHPAWPWMLEVKGIGPTLACKLLARLDLNLAKNASSFWSYCGLGTVPGEQYTCSDCGLIKVFPAGYEVTGKHIGCKSLMLMSADASDGVRAAQPKARKGQKRSYDAYAKKVCYLISMSFLKARGEYADFYNAEREKVERDHPNWNKGARYYKALRKTQKLFLSHLYEVWCEATGKEYVEAYALKILNHDGKISPWDMVKKKKVA